MTRYFRLNLAGSLSVLLVLALTTSGCNVFESFYTEGESEDTEVLLQDASYAIRKNEPQKAVTILEKAYQKEPNNPEVRVQLATALLAANDVNVIDLAALYENISKAPTGSAGQGAFSKSANHCTFNDAAIGTPAVRPFDPTYSDYEELRAKTALFDRVMTLIEPLLPDALEKANYDAPDLTTAQANAYVTELRGKGLNDEQIANALLINAVSRIIQIYNDMFFSTPGVTWYLVKGPTGNEYVGACATNVATVKAKAACQLPKLQGAANSLYVRGVLVGGEAATLSTEFNSALTKLEAELGDGATCTTTT